MNTLGDDYYSRRTDLVWNILNDELVIIDPQNGFVHLLNNTGKQIFEFLECTQSIEELCEKIKSIYNISDNNVDVKADIIEYVNELMECGIVNEVKL